MRATLNTLKSLGIGLGLLVSGMLAASGCGTSEAAEDSFDLSQLPIASELDSAASNGQLVWVRPGTEQVNCVRAPCPSYMVHEVNTGVTQLAYAYDWRALNLGRDQQSSLNENLSSLLLRGRFAVVTLDGQALKVFQVTRASTRLGSPGDLPSMDKYYAVRTESQSCGSPPCPPLSAMPLNQAVQPETWSGVDLSQLNLSERDRQALVTDMQGGFGYVSARNLSNMPVVLTSAFHPLTDPQL